MGKCLSGHRVDVFLIVEETRSMLQFRKEPFAQCLERQSQNLELNHCRGSSASPPCRKSCRRSCSPSTVRRETAYRPRHARGAFSLRHSYGKIKTGDRFHSVSPVFHSWRQYRRRFRILQAEIRTGTELGGAGRRRSCFRINIRAFSMRFSLIPPTVLRS